MPAFAVQTLINRAAAIADMHDEFVQEQTWVDWCNVERRALQIALARQGGAMQDLNLALFTASDTLTISGEILAIVGIWEVTSSQKLRPIPIRPFMDSFWQQSGGPVTGPAVFASLEDTNTGSTNSTVIRLYPRPTANQYLVVTSKAPPAIGFISDQISLPMGLEERIVLGMARRALIKEESDIEDVTTLIKEQDALVEEYCWNRSLAASPAARNVDRAERGWISDMDFPNPDLWTWL